MSSKKDILEYIKRLDDALENIHLIIEKEQPKWYERKPFKNTLCWVSDNVEKPTKKEGIIAIIEDYDETSTFPFLFQNGTIYAEGYKYAAPLTKKEVHKLTLEVQEHEK